MDANLRNARKSVHVLCASPPRLSSDGAHGTNNPVRAGVWCVMLPDRAVTPHRAALSLLVSLIGVGVRVPRAGVGRFARPRLRGRIEATVVRRQPSLSRSG